MGASGNKSCLRGDVVPCTGPISVGLPSSTDPASSSPPQLDSTLGQAASTGPAFIPLPQASSSTGPQPPSPPLQQIRPSALSPSKPSSSHVVISLSSHATLVSLDPTTPLPIPAGLVTGALGAVHAYPSGPMDTLPPQPIQEVSPPSGPMGRARLSRYNDGGSDSPTSDPS
ncbi:hypothetical protein K2173_025504 [Erythroxylum novogranatense]|uniref:Uncharacterized protein n=1 Tax=Erythroxylum novogranatense TaxID=1862640 RepID=A0AAV8T9W9_9ROSI|nr:hypothetical protein K2173_025504 [Erythroxylum novogranatense]